jgi:hypothetical protein
MIVFINLIELFDNFTIFAPFYLKKGQQNLEILKIGEKRRDSSKLFHFIS